MGPNNFKLWRRCSIIIKQVTRSSRIFRVFCLTARLNLWGWKAYKELSLNYGKSCLICCPLGAVSSYFFPSSFWRRFSRTVFPNMIETISDISISWRGKTYTTQYSNMISTISYCWHTYFNCLRTFIYFIQ